MPATQRTTAYRELQHNSLRLMDDMLAGCALITHSVCLRELVQACVVPPILNFPSNGKVRVSP